MKLLSTLAAVAGLCAAMPALSAPVTIDFEDQTSFASLNIASNPYGIAANGALLALANDGTGTGSNGEFFSNNPSGSYVMFATAPLPGERAEITSTSGFTSSVSFYYSSDAAGSVFARDASGSVLGEFDFLANSTNASSPFNTWTLATLTFNGLAHSIDFSGAVDGSGQSVAAFDNLTVNPVPLPAGILLLPSGLAALGLMGRRRKVA
jgi:hypothetical protein